MSHFEVDCEMPWSAGAFSSHEPSWLELPQVYVVLSKHATIPSYSLIPQAPKESQIIVYEVSCGIPFCRCTQACLPVSKEKKEKN